MMHERIQPEIAENLVDFYKQWPDLKPEAASMKRKANLTDRERVLLEWMIFVVDRVGPADLDPE